MRIAALCVALAIGLPNAAFGTLAREPKKEHFSVELPSGIQEDRYTSALKLLVSGDLKGAESAFRTILKEKPKSTEALLGLAEIAFRKKQPAEGEARLKEALQANPNDPNVHSSLGRLNSLRANASAALYHFTEASRLAPQSIAAHMDLGDFQNDLGKRPDLAIKEYQKVLAIQPEHAGANYALGVAQQKQGRKSDALLSFTKATKLAPDNPIPFEGLARLHASDKKFDLALTALDDILSRHNNLARTRILRSEILAAKGDAAGSLRELEIVEKAAPTNSEFVLRLAMAYHAQGKLDDASRQYLKAIDLDPNAAVAYNNWANIALHQNKSLNDAELRAKKSVELAGKNAEFHETLGQILLAQGKKEEALTSFKKAQELAPNDPQLISGIGIALANKGMPMQARPFLERALMVTTKFPGADATKKALNALDSNTR